MKIAFQYQPELEPEVVESAEEAQSVLDIYGCPPRIGITIDNEDAGQERRSCKSLIMSIISLDWIYDNSYIPADFVFSCAAQEHATEAQRLSELMDSYLSVRTIDKET